MFPESDAEWEGWSRSQTQGRLISLLSLAGVETRPHGNESALRKKPGPAQPVELS